MNSLDRAKAMHGRAVAIGMPGRFERDILAGYIGAIEAVVALMDDMDPYWRDGWSDEQSKLFEGLPGDKGRKTFVNFERLFPEERE